MWLFISTFLQALYKAATLDVNETYTRVHTRQCLSSARL
ncbi:hypothetical protein KP509_25G020900 [Ceratopteris richardii]|uniref:Uncharacterized protein n=1 Tax=Ceratopteris richardii TaxID=49495 RepID=A0A8T2RQK8_CERRI|nr:hypothetical protein KP509_25G020900 [Ceratopteris richardii]